MKLVILRAKGHLILKGLFGILNSSKTNSIMYYDTSGRLVFVHFLEEIEDTKKTFRNQLTFSRQFEKEVNTAVLAFSLAFITTGAVTDSIFLEKLPVKTFFLLIFL